MFFFTKNYSFPNVRSLSFMAFSLLCLTSFSHQAFASDHKDAPKNDGSDLSVRPSNSDENSKSNIQNEAFAYRSQTDTKAKVKEIQIQKPVLRNTPADLIEGSFILKNTANKDFLLKGISSEKCKTVGQYQDTQVSVETTEDASGNIFRNLPVPRISTIAFPFSSFHLACVPKNKNSFANGSQIPFVFHFEEGNQTYIFTVNNNA